MRTMLKASNGRIMGALIATRDQWDRILDQLSNFDDDYMITGVVGTTINIDIDHAEDPLEVGTFTEDDFDYEVNTPGANPNAASTSVCIEDGNPSIMAYAPIEAWHDLFAYVCQTTLLDPAIHTALDKMLRQDLPPLVEQHITNERERLLGCLQWS